MVAITQLRMAAELSRTLIITEIARAQRPDGDPDLHSVPLQTDSLVRMYRSYGSGRFSRLGCQRRMCWLFRQLARQGRKPIPMASLPPFFANFASCHFARGRFKSALQPANACISFEEASGLRSLRTFGVVYT